MKRIKTWLVISLGAILMFTMVGCSGGSQEVNFQGFKMEIPSAWELEKNTQTDDYAVYEELNSIGHDYKLVLKKTFALLPKCDNSMDKAAQFLKETKGDNASYSDVSDPVAGKFAGKYDMHTITCKYNAKNPMEKTKESTYACKLIRIYMGDRDVEIEFSTAKDDFVDFDKAIENAKCN